MKSAISGTEAIDQNNTCRVRLIYSLLLAFHAGSLAVQALQDSPSWDEIGHYAAGTEHWHFGSFRLYSVNPPLVRLWALLPTAVAPTGFDLCATEGTVEGRPEFTVGKEFATNAPRTFFLSVSVARLVCIPLSLIGACICYAWSRSLYGPSAGILSLGLWVFSPSVLAYGHLITPDLGAAAIGVAASYVFWRWLRHPGRGLTLGCGAVLGFAQLAKTTWTVLFLLWPVQWLIYRSRSERRRELLQGAMMVLIAIWIMNLGYGFEGSLKRLGDYRFLSQALSAPEPVHPDGFRNHNRFAGTWLGRLPVPLPASYVTGVDFIRMEFERKYWSYLRGEWRFGGWWYYYLYAMLIKEPLGTWLLLLLAVGVTLFCRGSYSAPWRDESVLLAPAIAVIALVSSQTGFNHHLRYVLPAFPFLFIWISKVARSFELGHRAVAAIVVACLAWSIASSLSVFPHSLSYFNELAGGPKNGHWHLGNSNADWGQDLLYLKKWYDHNPQARPLHLGYDLPLIDPRLIGIEWHPLPVGSMAQDQVSRAPDELGPRPGWHAVSVNWLHECLGRYDYFNDLKPVDWVGYTLPIYYITLEQANELRRRYGLPELPGDMAPDAGGPAP